MPQIGFDASYHGMNHSAIYTSTCPEALLSLMAEETKASQQKKTLEDVTDDEIKRARMHASSWGNSHFYTMFLIGCNGSIKLPHTGRHI